MKKAILTSATALLLMMSAGAHAFDELKPSDQRRLTNEVHEMQVILKLSDADADRIKQAKADMMKITQQLVAQHGRGTDEFKEARRPHWRNYQQELFSVITRDQLKEYNQKKSQ
ncbi:hypothetical protein [Thaumasiovibrio subtropicus]|uniref:hypothetical protein n=1 Tax=Thaumasiovibrio subtropicus TaxID=1891207 RepID=UPI00131B6C23|nr:hypothetical protein [Thaumasiovibrio subtropicus]